MAGIEASILDKTMDWLEEKLEPVNSSMDIITTPAGPTTEDPLFRDAFFHPSLIPDSEPCKAILHYHLGNTNLRVWDLIILIPNLAFLLFLFYKLPSTRLKLRATNSELFRSLYSIVLTCSLASALRCLMSMMLHLDSVEHDLANKGVWVTTRFLLLTAELSVAAFGCAFGVREDKVSIQRITLVCAAISFLVCAIQAYLEIFQPFYGFQVANGFDLYGQGGPAYLAITSSLLVVVYLGLLATMLCPSHFLPTLLPHSSSLAIYSSIQLALHLLTAAGSAMLATNVHPGLCLTNLTSFASFSLLSPLIFGCFLHNWFAATQPNLLFAYKAQLDDGEEEPSSIINMSRDEDVVEDSHEESLIGRQN